GDPDTTPRERARDGANATRHLAGEPKRPERRERRAAAETQQGVRRPSRGSTVNQVRSERVCVIAQQGRAGPGREPEQRQHEPLTDRPHDRTEGEPTRKAARRARGGRNQAVKTRPRRTIDVVHDLARARRVLQRAALREVLDDTPSDGFGLALALLLELRG